MIIFSLYPDFLDIVYRVRSTANKYLPKSYNFFLGYNYESLTAHVSI